MEFTIKNSSNSNIADKRLNKKLLLINIALILLSACGSTSKPTLSTIPPNNLMVADLQIVDCLLPGQVRSLGNSTYITPRRPIIATASDCKIRGGEFVAYDRADYKSALNVWLAAAKQGNLEAQTNVGEIFEKGSAGKANYQAAAIWYKKAAKAGYARAQFNLATLYEQGLGVEQDSLIALNLYRQSWGLPENDLIYQAAAYKEQQHLKNQWQQKIDNKSGQIKLLERQIQQLHRDSKPNTQNQYNKDIQQLNDLITNLKSEQKNTKQKFLNLPVFREPQTEKATEDINIDLKNNNGLNFGKYYALIIGNQNYDRIGNLNTPHNDAQQLAQILQSKYNFSVQMLLDANNIEVMQAINDLNSIVTEEDNLLIFYAGHGTRLQSGDVEDGYWLPVNADPPPTNTYWVSNEFITRHLARLKAKRILIVADSCYAGLLANQKNNLLMGIKTNYTKEYLSYKLAKKSRFVLSSGGDQPVLDNGSNGHSVFASAFLEQLKNNQKIMAGPDLYLKISEQVSKKANAMGVIQVPQLSAIKGANHEAGDFFFIPTNFYNSKN